MILPDVNVLIYAFRKDVRNTLFVADGSTA